MSAVELPTFGLARSGRTGAARMLTIGELFAGSAAGSSFSAGNASSLEYGREVSLDAAAVLFRVLLTSGVAAFEDRRKWAMDVKPTSPPGWTAAWEEDSFSASASASCAVPAMVS